MERKATLLERVSAMIVALAMLFSMMPVQAFADNTDQGPKTTAAAQVQTADPQDEKKAATQAAGDTGNIADPGEGATNVAVTRVTLEPSTMALTITDTDNKPSQKITATVEPADATNKTLKWESNNIDVAKVSEDGTVTAVGNGEATITATAQDGSNVSGTCAVTVTTATQGISFAENTENPVVLDLTNNKTTTLTAVVTPATATDKVEWQSSADGIAKVEQDENNSNKATVTAVAAGTAVITAKSGEREVTCNVVVKSAATAVTIEGPRDNTVEAVAYKESGITFTATTTPSTEYCTDTVAWSIDSDAATAGFSIDESGKLSVPENGLEQDSVTVKVTATAGSATNTFTLEIKKAADTVTIGEQGDITYDEAKNVNLTANANATNANITFALDETAENTAGATVTLDGTVAYTKVGTFTVKATSAGDGFYMSATSESKTFTVAQKELTIKVKDGFKVTKTSDGTTALVGDNATQIKKALSLDGIVKGDTVTLTVDTRAAAYKESSPFVNNEINGLTFALGGNDAGNYTLNNACTVPAKIEAAKAGADEYNLSAGANAQITLADGATVNFTSGTNTEAAPKVYWYKSAPALAEDQSNISLLDEKGAAYTFPQMAQGENTCEKVYVQVDGTYYGPITLKYNADSEGPKLTPNGTEQISFGQNGELSYTFTAADEQSGVDADTIKYYIGDKSNLNVNDITGWEQASAVKGEGNSYTFTITAPASGYLYIQASDFAGNQTSVDAYRALVVETDTPDLTLTCDDADSYEQTHTIKIEASDSTDEGSAPYAYSGIYTVTYVLSQGDKSVASGTVMKNGPLTEMDEIAGVRTYENLAFELPESEKLNGDYVLTVEAKDFCGNSTKKNITLHYDNTAPEITAKMTSAVEAIDGAYYYKADNGSLTVTFTDDHLYDEGGVYTVTVASSGNGADKDSDGLETKLIKTQNDLVKQDDTTGVIQFTEEEIATLKDGTITVTVAATDHAKNVTEEITDVTGAVKSDANKLTFQFELDKTAPVLKTVAITDGNYYESDSKVYYNKDFNVTYTVEDANYYAGGVTTNDTEKPDMTLNAESSTIRLSVARQDNVANAIYTPVLTIKDKAGNPLVADIALTAEGANGAAVENGTVKLKNQLVLDTVAPKLTKVESTDAAGHIYAEGVYYQGGFDATFTVEEINYDNARDGTMGKTVLTVQAVGDATRVDDARADDGNTHTVKATVSEIGTAKTVYTIQLNVVDKAGNALVEVPGATYTNSGDDQPDYTTIADGTATLKNRIMDNVAPVVSISYTYLDATHFYKENGDNAAATAYYNMDLTATFAFEDAGSLDGSKIFYARSFEGVQDTFGNFDTNKADTNTAPSFDGSTNDNLKVEAKADQNGTYTYTIYGEDKAGNLLTVKESDYTYDADKKMQGKEVSGVGKDKAYTTAPKAMDTVNPTAVIDYTALDDTHYYKKGDTQFNAYYNRDFTATFTFADTYGTGSKTYNMDQAKLRYTKIKTDDNAKSQDVLNDAALGRGITTPSQTVSYSVTGTADNDHYVFGAYGEDKAGNPLIVTEYNTTSTSGSSQYTAAQAAACQLNYHKVLDTVAPVFTLTVNDPTNDLSIAVDEQNRAFYNGDIKADFVVTDTNLDSGKVKSKAASRTGTDFNYDTEDVAWAGIDLTKNNPGSPETTVSLSESGTADGIYRFEIEGEDRAGNRLVQSSAEAAENDFRATLKVGEGRFWTNLKVRDTLAPVLDIELSDGSVFYKARLGEATQQNNTYYNLQENRPYRQASSATGTLTKTDCSPVSVAYVIDSTTATQTEPGSAYSHDAIGLSMNGEQVFSIAKLVVKDRAGNVSTMPKPGNKIYLDVTAPTEDELAPTVSVVAKESGEGRSVAGRDLFNSNVTVQANVTDPGEGVRSSGLYQVYYQVLVNDADWTDKVSVSGKGSVKAAGIIGYGTSGKDYSSPDAVDENITSQDTINFGFDANTFNYNDVKIYVWAEDNSGNMLTKSEAAHYFFGIDITTPTIEVRYDNNDAQNEKYFKADRTATVTITERNFDPSQTVITTESKEISSWTYQPGSMPNGDDDKWIATVGYTQDGDYTFDVSTIDLVGHQAEPADYGDSVAPREFTIDKTRPIISIRFDNDDVRNGKYYNATRTATVSIEEHNFSTDGVVLTTTANIQEGAVAAPGAGGWSSGGDMNTATVPFTEDGNYTMHVEYTDLAGNEAEPQDVDEFVVDTTAPELTFSINDEAFDEVTYTPHAYNGEVVPSITYHDINYDMSGTQMSIVGAKNVDSQILNGAPAEDAMGGVYTCENIAETPENDDVYTCTGKVVDMAGNESTVDFVFSVNRYGSNYILSEATQQLVDNYYTNRAPDLGVTEINVNTLKSKEITYALNGDIKTLEPNTEYSVQESGTETSWKQYDYNIFSSNFTQEGIYDITIYSEDEAGNANSNHTERVKEYSKNISFVLDQTAPSITISGVEEDGRYDTDTRLISVGYSENFAIDTITITNGDKTDSYTADQLNATGDTLEFEVPASNSKQTVTVTAADKAGNTVTVESPRFLLTSNKLIQFVNNTPLLVGSILLLVLIVLAIIDYLRKGFLYMLLHKKKSESKN